MIKYIVAISLLLIITKTMAQNLRDRSQVYYHDDYTQFVNKLNGNPSFTRTLLKKEGVFIKNPRVVMHMPLSIGGNLPENGVMFEHMDLIARITGLKSLHLSNLFIEELPVDMLSLKHLTDMELCFTRDTNVDEVLKVLKRLPALKKLDLNGSRLSMKQRNRIHNELAKVGVTVNDVIFLSD